ncbi:MAG: LuxR C-terminal-related transcriptional regulator [Actinomycetota bacterium]
MESLKTVVNSLTGRQKQILRLINQGLTNKEIASRLNLSTSTINNHCKNIYRKLQVNNRFDAAQIANDHRLV